MTLKPNYFLIPLATIAVALVGSFFTRQGMGWYDAEILKPALTPPKIAFPIAWNLIFLCATISALIIWNKGKTEQRFLWIFKRTKTEVNHSLIILLFILNAVLNVFWSWLFFYRQMIFASLIEMFVLNATILLLMILSWKISKPASLLLAPYFIWVSFASYLTYQIWILNP